VNMLLEALSDAWGRNGPLAFVADWRAALAGLDERPAPLICCAALVTIVVLMFAGPGDRRVGYRRGRFFSHNEKSFSKALDVALGRDDRPFTQVRLAELADPTPGLSDRLRRRALGGVRAKSVDFAICDGLSLDPVVAVEVDDLSHLLPERLSRDAFVNAVFAEIGAPLPRVKGQRFYRVEELRDLIARAGLHVVHQPEGAML
jgi:Protein of unknown function (DUF2726)